MGRGSLPLYLPDKDVFDQVWKDWVGSSTKQIFTDWGMLDRNSLYEVMKSVFSQSKISHRDATEIREILKFFKIKEYL